ncbi:HK97-gp10 family putative phage morphogenesis protein [Peptoclostridium litorale]|nr:HK97-gp10 family putative phage morphogenesis protein [Peptoclostridium litorale]
MGERRGVDEMAEIKLEGMDELLNRLEQLGKKGAQIENNALKKAGEIVKESIESRAPKRTGKLKESIKVSKIKTKEGQKIVEVGPDGDGFYGKFLEFGTTKMAAQPFMGPGFEAVKDEAAEAIKEEIKKGLGL